jgi:hypothetical protein
MDQRLKRAHAIRLIGKEFLEIGKLVGASKEEVNSAAAIKARAEVAVMHTMARAQGQEINDEDAEEQIRQHRAMAAKRDSDMNTQTQNL